MRRTFADARMPTPRRVDLETKRNDIRGRLQRLSGPGDAFEAFMERLGETDLQAISDAIREATEDGDHCAADVERLSTVRGEAQAELGRLTSEEESSRLRMERNQLLEQIQGHAREWAVYAIAENLLKEAQSKFERERQPDVIRHSQGFFGRITQERYQTVFSPLDRSEIHVTDSSGGTKQPNELRRGTREQLFLSLRFGYIRDLGGRAERPPVLVDEALVNFDPERGSERRRGIYRPCAVQPGARVHLSPANRRVVSDRGCEAGHRRAAGHQHLADTQVLGLALGGRSRPRTSGSSRLLSRR